MRKLLIILGILIVLLLVGEKMGVYKNTNLKDLFRLPAFQNTQTIKPGETQNIVYEESVITKVVETSLPSVVTVKIHKTTSPEDDFNIDPFDPFGRFRRTPQRPTEIDQNIGSGFIISADGLVITNKHVVGDTEATYQIVTNDKKVHNVEKIYRDPLNDLAILKIGATGLTPLPLGDSSNLKLGQIAIAIGTPLGEFTNTVTSGIVSGLGRGITAGSPLEGYVEKLDNVIQTDAAINPGNSGGPLLNSSGQAIGINTAVAQEGQNIGFAIPINIVKDLIDKFNKQGGTFERPYIGVRYRMIDRQTAVMNDLVEGAYVIEVLKGSPAEKADVQVEDVIVEIDGQKVKASDDQSVAKAILDKKIGDTVRLKLWRNGENLDKQVKLDAAK